MSKTGGAFLQGEFPTQRPFNSFEKQCLAAIQPYLEVEVRPRADRLEDGEDGLLESLLREVGRLGLMGVAIPEEFGGIALSRTLIARFCEETARACPSFAIPFNVHSGVATLPLLWFGTDAQKAHWLPKLATGEALAAFALSEPNAGSDALGLSCRATRTPEGGWRLNGQKVWITNAGIADLFTVFAKVDGEHLTAFLVERGTPGLSVGRDEKKLGLKGSRTASLFFDDAELPRDAVLGEIGKGYRAALFPLNVGRLNIGAAALGMAKEALSLARAHASARKQFGQPLDKFEIIGDKLARMAEKIARAESVIYRTAALLDSYTSPVLHGGGGAAAGEEFAIECAIAKIYCTEMLDFVVDEALQIHGGYGFSEEYAIARLYRDSRIFRIFEGTNEINRLTIAVQLHKRLVAGRIAPLDKARVGRLTTALAALEANPESQLKAVALADITIDLYSEIV
ncbi:acyl-CoA dehydrogenase family protein [Armatimonas sp.]|uniref:acyl-CoA dehydrogenase family protein n=1 Tax=Armatimonas sp. TaxID=1872638 RepID=UPI0037517F27